ncbi:hypothetical protein [Brasilonema sp. UFV-L1]|nr:hypothetical protein [Brasilonema sp. UFV-L1]
MDELEALGIRDLFLAAAKRSPKAQCLWRGHFSIYYVILRSYLMVFYN